MEEQSTKITEEVVYEALKDCYDPEIPVNIVDLGLVYGITIVDGWVGVKMTLTTPGCGLADAITNEVRERILRISGVNSGDVRLVWNPPWNPRMMTEEAQKKLGLQS